MTNDALHTTPFEAHIRIATVQYAFILFLCVCGILLNVLMLIVFIKKKQIRRSVYTTYMIQIATTDLLVCLVWLMMASMHLQELPSSSELGNIIHSDKADPTALLETKEVKNNFLIYRFTYAVYNFHYYNNIFLLAAMSIERCVAVWKSLRCQRYLFNRKFIYAVSVIMWLLALACALPSFINPDLITENDESNLLLSKDTSTFDLMKCYKPLERAIELNQSFVTGYNNVTLEECLLLIEKVGEKAYGPLYPEDDYEEIYSDLPSLEGPVSQPSYDDNLYESKSLYYQTGDEDNISSIQHSDELNGDTMNREVYSNMFKMTVRLAMESIMGDLEEICDPRLSEEAKYYQISVNLVIGFFIPFLAIFITNFAIGIMIWKRARYRLGSDNGNDAQDDSMVGRRLSDMLKYFGHGSNSRVEADSAQYKRESPVLRRKAKTRRADEKETPSKQEQTIEKDGYKKKTPGTTITFHTASKTKSEDGQKFAKASYLRPRSSSFSMQTRRTSRESASSAESFQTDLTTLQTSSSPGVRLSAPLFTQQDNRTLVQRACSADNSNTGCQKTHPVATRRWSSEVFRSSIMVDEEKKANAVYEKPYKESHITGDNNDETRLNSSAPYRGDAETTESTHELLPSSHTRLYVPKSRNYHRQSSHQANCRSRAYSAASRSSGGSTLRKSMVHKNAERKMRVAKTVFAYVLVFTICWLPQRIVYVVYFTENLIGLDGYSCHIAFVVTRIISFFSVLLNPIVYAVTQRELRHFMTKIGHRLCKCICPRKWCYKRKANQPKQAERPKQENGLTGNENGDFSGIPLNNFTTDEFTKQERHARNRELWTRMVQRLGRKNIRLSLSASGFSTQGKPSDDTIDEEREDEKGPSSKGQSSSNSFKLVNGISGWDDWQQMIDMAVAKGEQTKNLSVEAIP